MALASEIISDAYIEAGLIKPGQTVSTERQDYGRRRLNRLMEQWSGSSAFVTGELISTYNFTSLLSSYTFGPSAANFAITARPTRIDKANLIFNQNVRYPLTILDYQQYGDITYKGISSNIPFYLFTQGTSPNWTLYFWPLPADASMQVEIFTPIQSQTFNTVSDVLTSPVGYQEAITQVLAEALRVGLQMPVSPELAKLARTARGALQKLNSAPLHMINDLNPSRGQGVYDIRIGGYR